MFSLDWQITKAEWISNPPLRWNAGLERAGLTFRNELQSGALPSPRPLNVRSGTLSGKANFNITQVGNQMEFGSTFYLKYALFGVGIYGPNQTPIRPVRAPFLAWQTHEGTWVRAKEVQGYIWEGKLDDLKEKMQEAFREGVRDYKEG